MSLCRWKQSVCDTRSSHQCNDRKYAPQMRDERDKTEFMIGA